ncbi:MAG: class I SAM-dependent methyltransferase [Prosthecobacter sp.]|nr:class I SAM-dependent methyltransferase [Prosthecobacter sp.]
MSALAQTASALGSPRLGFHLLVFDELLQHCVDVGGPFPSEYAELTQAIHRLGDDVREGLIAPSALLAYVQAVTRRAFEGTMQAEALAQKYGYNGDFEIIDHIYTQKIHPDPGLRAWDLYFHAQAAPNAVRNRKAYFQRLMQAHIAVNSGPEPLSVLNIASGPARDLCEFFQNYPDAAVEVDCVDVDARAIAYAQTLCAPWTDRIHFHHRNVLRYVPGRSFDLVWSAGLFDYLNERLFVHLLKAMMAVTKKGGEVVVGNFSDYNPSRDYMELLGNWHLEHRSRETLMRLAAEAGAPSDRIQVLWEPEGVNYFLHIQR